MPRDRRAVIGTAIWNEPSIRALPFAQQHAYLLAYTQSDLNRCGVLAYRPKRWAGFAADLTVRHLRRQYDALAATRHVVLDEDHEELLIRTYIGHDGLLAQPLVVAAMVRDYATITSPTVRIEILRELRRLWDTDRPDAERTGLLLLLGVDVVDVGIAENNPRQADRIRGAIGGGLLAPTIAAIADGHINPYRKGLPEGLPEGMAEGLTDPPCARSRVSPTPAPTPTPTPTPSESSVDHQTNRSVPREPSLGLDQERQTA